MGVGRWVMVVVLVAVLVMVLVVVIVQVVVGVCCCRRLRTMIHYTPLHVVTMLYERCVHVCYYSKEWCRWGQD